MGRPPETAVSAGSRGPRWARRPRWLATVLVGLGYLAASLAVHHAVLPRLTTATSGWVTSDAYLFAWWLNWVPWAVQHDLDPLFTNYQHYPVGVNAMWNTTVPALGLLFAPVTLAAGPVATFNVAMVLGPVVSGLALVLALHPYVSRLAPRAVAGLLYGFGPFMAAHLSVGHVNLVWALLPPVLLWAVHTIFVRRSATPLRDGALLGIAFAVQTGIYSQTVALGALALVVTGVVLAIHRPGEVAARLSQVTRAALACVAAYAIVCAYPLYQLLAGPARPRAQIRDPDRSGADLANVVVPTEVTALRFPGGAELLRGHAGEQGGYAGVAVLAVLAVAVLATRNATARIAATVGAVLFVLSLGTTAVVLGHDTGVPLPWDLVGRIPLIAQAEAVRLQVFVALCVAVVVAVWLDHLAARPPGPRRTAAAALTAAALAPWLPADTQVATPVAIPAFFTRSAPELLTDGDVAETVPRISGQWTGGADPLLWQVASGMAYRTTGGYFIGSDATHDLLLEAPVGAFQQGVDTIAEGGTPPAAAARTAAQELAAAGVTVVLVAERAGTDQRPVLAWTTRVTGTPGRKVDDVWVFPLVR